jgi:hypothetical protein
VMPLRVSLADLYNGKSLQFSIRREVDAWACADLVVVVIRSLTLVHCFCV